MTKTYRTYRNSQNRFWDLGSGWEWVDNIHSTRDLNANGYRSYVEVLDVSDGIRKKIDVQYRKKMNPGQDFLAGFTFGAASRVSVHKKTVVVYIH